jgi:hypothetical protein
MARHLSPVQDSPAPVARVVAQSARPEPAAAERIPG